MTVPHPDATGSLGPVFIRWAEERTGKPLRWWQRLVAARLLETDGDGRLVWETLILTMARQLGKSWLLRELLLWRIHQGGRFGEPQDVLHTGKDLAVCKEVQRPGRLWAKARPDVFKVREVNGQEEIELLADGSRWMLRAKEAVYGYSVSLGAADEAWKVKASSIEEGLTPTMAEREQAQLLLVSTAHRLATPLMLLRRKLALDQLEDGTGDLLIEWSAPGDAPLDDLAGWRQASPHWTPRRERMVRKQLEGARAGEVADPDEPDPIEAFAAQWLNRWPRRVTEVADDGSEPLLPDWLWQALVDPELESDGPLFVAVEDNWGKGAAVAATSMLPDGRIEVGGWTCDDWDEALEQVQQVALQRRVRQLLVGASMLGRVPPGTVPTPQAAGQAETRPGLAEFRDLAAGYQLVHNSTGELDRAVRAARVKEAQAGLILVPSENRHLVRALMWAVHAAHKPAPQPSVY